MDLAETLIEDDWSPTQADRRLYLKHQGQMLVGALSTHVDDLKGGCTSSVFCGLRAKLEQKYGDLTLSRPPFECIGVIHQQDGVTKAITCSQDHYVKQLRPIDVATIRDLPPSAPVSAALHGLFTSLLGAIAWLVLTRPDVIVYVGKLQRAAKAPTVCDVIDLNKVLKWVRRIPSSTLYQHLTQPLCMLVIADSAYRADDVDALAIRAAILVIIEIGGQVPGGKMHVWEFFSRKQSRVNRGTFGAELNNLVEAAELGLLLRGLMHEVKHGPQSAEALRTSIDESVGMELHLVTDAHSVFAAVTAPELATPNERHLLYTLRSLRDHLDARRVSTIHRVDTRDMLADALTKGGVGRLAILTAFRTGIWSATIRDQLHSWAAPRQGQPAIEDG